ncbi:6505_t:CDS:2, partial [Gigaspora margarita]
MNQLTHQYLMDRMEKNFDDKGCSCYHRTPKQKKLVNMFRQIKLFGNLSMDNHSERNQSISSKDQIKNCQHQISPVTIRINADSGKDLIILAPTASTNEDDSEIINNDVSKRQILGNIPILWKLQSLLQSIQMYAIGLDFQLDYLIPCIICWVAEHLDGMVIEQLSALFQNEFEIIYQVVKPTETDVNAQHNASITNEFENNELTNSSLSKSGEEKICRKSKTNNRKNDDKESISGDYDKENSTGDDDKENSTGDDDKENNSRDEDKENSSVDDDKENNVVEMMTKKNSSRDDNKENSGRDDSGGDDDGGDGSDDMVNNAKGIVISSTAKAIKVSPIPHENISDASTIIVPKGASEWEWNSKKGNYGKQNITGVKLSSNGLGCAGHINSESIPLIRIAYIEETLFRVSTP